MERHGIGVDRDYLNELGHTMRADAVILLKELVGVAAKHGMPNTSFDSPKQLRELLFDRMNLELPDKFRTEKGATSTNAEALEFLYESTKDEFLSKLLKYRAIKKLETSYVNAISEALEGNTIHTSFNQTGTVTGRFSCRSPNMQSIPRGESGYDFKRIFIARPGNKLVVADYSQMELRILAYFSNDQYLLQAYANDEDIHAATAKLLGCTRQAAKTINFGIVYGQGAWGLAQSLRIPEKEAQKLIDEYLFKLPGVKRFMAGAVEQLRDRGYVETITRRRRRFPEYKLYKELGRFSELKRMERQAGNAIIQGTVADFIKIAMRNIHYKVPCRILLQIHDELLVEVPENNASDYTQEIQHEMEHALELKTIKIKAEPKVCEYWTK